MSKEESAKYCKKKQRKDSKNISWKVSKSFWRRKNKKQENGREHYENLSKGEKQKLVEYRKIYFEAHKN